MKCLILAGGFATRLYPLTINTPKALLAYKGRPVISHIIDRIPWDMNILVSTNKRFEADFLEWRKGVEREVEIGVEEALSEKEKKGAVGAVDHWIKAKKIKEDLMLIAGDNYFELDLSDLIRRFNGKNAIVAAFDVGDKEKACEVGKRCQVGVLTVEDGKVVRFDEKPEEPSSSVVSTGISILPRRAFAILSRYCRSHNPDNLGSFIAYLAEREDVHAYVFDTVWMDIGDEILRGRLSM